MSLPFTDSRIFSSAQPNSLLALQTYTRESSRPGWWMVSTETRELALLPVAADKDEEPLPSLLLSSMLFVSSLSDSRGTSLILNAFTWWINKVKSS